MKKRFIAAVLAAGLTFTGLWSNEADSNRYRSISGWRGADTGDCPE